MRKVYVIGHKRPDVDSIVSAIAYAEYKRMRGWDAVASRAGDVDPETNYVLERFGFEAPLLLNEARGRALILVDHNEVAQAVEGLEEAEVLEIVDHHRLGGLVTAEPIFVHIEPTGSTSTIIADWYLRGGVKLSEEIAAILLCGIISDTIVLRAPTCTEKDRCMARKLAELSGLDIGELGKEMLELKSLKGERSPREVILSDFKEYTFGSVRVGIGHVETLRPEKLVNMRSSLLTELKHIKEEKGLSMALLMLTDVLKLDSYVFCVADDPSWFERAYGVKLRGGMAYMRGVSSRKKQLVPPLARLFGFGISSS